MGCIALEGEALKRAMKNGRCPDCGVPRRDITPGEVRAMRWKLLRGRVEM